MVGPNYIEAAQQTNGSNSTAANTASSAAALINTENRSCLNGHRFLNSPRLHGFRIRDILAFPL